MNNKLLTVGTLAFDTIETPFVRVERTMGGAANYSALASAIFDIEQAVVSVVGEDYPASFLQILSEREIDITQVEKRVGKKTFFWSGRYYENMNDNQRQRYDVRPGLTGLAQCMGRNDITIFEKIEYDLTYIKDYSLIQDIKIVFFTIKAVFTGRGADAGKNTIENELNDLKEENNKIAKD